MGGKQLFNETIAWVRYNAVDFSTGKLKALIINAESNEGSAIEVRLDKPNGQVIAKAKIAKSTDWKMATGLSVP